MHAEAEPHVRRHEQDAVSAGFLGFLRHLDGFDGILAVDAGDDGHHVAAFLGADLGDSLALGAAQAGDLAGVAVADEAFDSLAIEALDPAEVYAEFFFIDGVVIIQRDGNCRENGLEGFNFSHDFFSFRLIVNINCFPVRISVSQIPSRAGLGSRAAQTFVAYGCIIAFHFSLVNKTGPVCNFLHKACKYLYNSESCTICNLVFCAF